MDANIYGEIILNKLYPYCDQKFKNNCNIHQDNDPKHTAKVNRELMRDLNLNWLNSPIQNRDSAIIKL